MMSNAVIMLLTTLLFGKMIYWMHENRNNLGEAVKESLQTIFWCIIGIAVIVAVIAGGVWLLIQFVCEYPLLFIVLLLILANNGGNGKKRASSENNEQTIYPQERERSPSEVYYRIVSQDKLERLKSELNDLENKRDRTDWSEYEAYMYYRVIEQIDDLRHEIEELELYLKE